MLEFEYTDESKSDNSVTLEEINKLVIPLNIVKQDEAGFKYAIIIVTAIAVSPNVDKICLVTGYDRQFVYDAYVKLRRREIWKDNFILVDVDDIANEVEWSIYIALLVNYLKEKIDCLTLKVCDKCQRELSLTAYFLWDDMNLLYYDSCKYCMSSHWNMKSMDSLVSLIMDTRNP